jgi:hypothetical protein
MAHGAAAVLSPPAEPAVSVSVKPIVAEFTSNSEEESASTNWTMLPGDADVPVWGWKRTLRLETRRDDLERPSFIAGIASGTTSEMGKPWKPLFKDIVYTSGKDKN